MQAEIISVGTELLLGQIVDTNAAYLSALLPEFGVTLRHRTTVGDNEARLIDTLKQALNRADIVFTIGGLGPTQDDITKETVAKVVGDEMKLDAGSVEMLKSFFAKRGIEMPPSNIKQAMIPTRGRILPNPMGTAPGAAFETEDGKIVIVMPGPPREFIPMVNEQVAPYLREKIGKNFGLIRSRTLRVAGMGESSVEDKIKHFLSGTNPTVAPYAKTCEVHLRITAKAESEAEAVELIDGMDKKISDLLNGYIYGRNEDTLEKAVVELLIRRGLKLGLAESCTGGLIGNRITDVPGSSETLLSGVISYSNKAKKEILGVPEQLLIEHGAVSEQVARAMAEGIRKVSGSDIGVSVTGIAGPGGATPTKPVGLVYMAVSSDSGTIVQKHQFAGNRADVKLRASQAALFMLLRYCSE